MPLAKWLGLAQTTHFKLQLFQNAIQLVSYLEIPDRIRIRMTVCVFRPTVWTVFPPFISY